jgi:septum formation protein
MKKIFLASASPRRKALLEQLGLTFTVIPADIEETVRPGEAPPEFAVRVTWEKVIRARKNLAEGIIIAADTVVVLGDRIMQKPSSVTDAKNMLRLLSGKNHHVLTAVSLLELPEDRKIGGYEQTLVSFRELTPRDIDWYVLTGEIWGKAGAYAIQEKGALFIDRIEGSFSNVVGLPLRLVYDLFGKIGIDLKAYID